MYQIIILIASLSLVNLVLGQSATCVGITPQTTCEATGYCYWTTSCQYAECHKVTDVRACRQDTVTPANTGKLFSMSKCRELPSIDTNFLNQCMEWDQTTLMWAYVRFPTDITQLYSAKTTGGYLATQIMTAKYTSQYKYEVLTLNILKASTTELLNIMVAYVQMQNDLLDPEIHPLYLEKAIYESMQQIRDDVALKLTDNTRQPYYTWLWRMTDAYFLKMRSYQPYYISNKYLINFGFTHFNRFSIALQSQYQTTTVSWTTYSQNGYFELLVMPAEQFGFLNVDSDVIIVRPSKLTGEDLALTYTITWTWTYTGTQPDTSSKFYEINKTEMTIMTTPYGSCTTTPKSCSATFSNQSSSKAYLIKKSTATVNACPGRYLTRCRLNNVACTWTITTSTTTCAV